MEGAQMNTAEDLGHTDQDDSNQEEKGAIGYILLWAMGVPASLLFFIFLLRGCT
jgi:hypothetical protein